MENECLSEELLDFWKEKKVLILDELIEQKQCSVTTIRRHLKKSNALSSLNHNSKYYTLPCYAQFDSNGLWFYNGILFSKHGSLLNTIILC
jgi:hypothetical protein